MALVQNSSKGVAITGSTYFAKSLALQQKHHATAKLGTCQAPHLKAIDDQLNTLEINERPVCIRYQYNSTMHPNSVQNPYIICMTYAQYAEFGCNSSYQNVHLCMICLGPHPAWDCQYLQ